jgi:hypothetical protein
MGAPSSTSTPAHSRLYTSPRVIERRCETRQKPKSMLMRSWGRLTEMDWSPRSRTFNPGSRSPAPLPWSLDHGKRFSRRAARRGSSRGRRTVEWRGLSGELLGKDKDPHPADGAGVAGKSKRRRARKAFPLPAKMSRLTPNPVEDDHYAGHLAIPSAYPERPVVLSRSYTQTLRSS